MSFPKLLENINNGMPLPEVSGSAMTRLTYHQLHKASEDLLEAAGLLSEVGHHKGSLINKVTGELCILGAVEVATYKRIVRVWAKDYLLLATPAEDLDARMYRAQNACICLAATVGHLCECADVGKGALTIVTHYNDVHCPGGIVAYNMLRIAAARALVLSERKKAHVEKVLA